LDDLEVRGPRRDSRREPAGQAELRRKVTDLAVLTEINSAVGRQSIEELFRVIIEKSPTSSGRSRGLS
jgi:hypothetical protein